MSEVDPCDWCEEVLQPYLDRDLNETDVEIRFVEIEIKGGTRS